MLEMAQAAVSDPGWEGSGETNPGIPQNRESCPPEQTELKPVQGTPRKVSRGCSQGEEKRAEALEVLTKSVTPDRAGSAELDKDTMLQLLRVSQNCPIAERATELIRSAQEQGVDLPQGLSLVSGPSAFIPAEEILEEGPEQEALIEACLSTGGLDHVTMVMALHPAYLSCFLRTQNALLNADGPLPLPWRHYIVLTAASRHHCSYLVRLHSRGFLQAGGDERWLQGMRSAPPKLRSLQTLNKLLAHRPWLITQEHIRELVSPGADARWSLAELVQALILMSHAHCLSSFVWGCGINPEPDQSGASRPQSSSSRTPRSPQSPGREDAAGHEWSDAVREVEVLMKRMELLQQQEEEFSQEEMVTRFERERSESLLESPPDGLGGAPAPLSPFVEDADFCYEDFAPRGEQSPPTMRAQDYSWEDHGYCLLNRLLPDMSQLLEEKFQVVCGLTYNTMAMHRGVDTSMLRKALWNYIQCVYGIRYDDYDYGDVNQLLERSLKVYVKTVACHPEKTNHRMYSAFWRHFRHSEKVHVNLLLLEARLQGALLYALRAITRYMT